MTLNWNKQVRKLMNEYKLLYKIVKSLVILQMHDSKHVCGCVSQCRCVSKCGCVCVCEWVQVWVGVGVSVCEQA